MTLGRNVIDTWRERAQIDREFREGCLEDTVDLLLAGDIAVGLISLHDHIYATIGFEDMGALFGESAESLVEMLVGNLDEPGSALSTSTLFEIIGHLREDEGVDFKVAVARRDDAGARNGASGADMDAAVESVEVGREVVGAGTE